MPSILNSPLLRILPDTKARYFFQSHRPRYTSVRGMILNSIQGSLDTWAEPDHVSWDTRLWPTLTAPSPIYSCWQARGRSKEKYFINKKIICIVVTHRVKCSCRVSGAMLTDGPLQDDGSSVQYEPASQRAPPRWFWRKVWGQWIVWEMNGRSGEQWQMKCHQERYF